MYFSNAGSVRSVSRSTVLLLSHLRSFLRCGFAKFRRCGMPERLETALTVALGVGPYSLKEELNLSNARHRAAGTGVHFNRLPRGYKVSFYGPIEIALFEIRRRRFVDRGKSDLCDAPAGSRSPPHTDLSTYHRPSFLREFPLFKVC